MDERRARGYRLIPVGIPHMHYGRLGDTPMLSGDAEGYKSGSNEARQGAGPARQAGATRRTQWSAPNALVNHGDGGSIL
jgi:hypothetical protein